MAKISGTKLNRLMNKKVTELTEEDIDETLRLVDKCTKDSVYDYKTKWSREMVKEMVNQNSFWAAWQEGMAEPTIFANNVDAKEEVAELARNNPGQKAYLLRLEQIGSAITTDMVLKGSMAEEIDEDE